jgi:16S rRNA (guanine966-N2)-methyltransferase
VRLRGKQQITTVPGQSTRPTASRVREAIFNIWQFEIPNCRWLDICAGTGAMGAEALCRGASVVVGIEQDRRACGIIRQNWQKFAQSPQQYQVLQMDAVAGLASLKGQQFDRIYVDPPYTSPIYLPVLEALSTYNLLAGAGEIAVESGRRQRFPAQSGNLEITSVRRYGRTEITFYRHVEPKTNTVAADVSVS